MRYSNINYAIIHLFNRDPTLIPKFECMNAIHSIINQAANSKQIILPHLKKLLESVIETVFPEKLNISVHFPGTFLQKLKRLVFFLDTKHSDFRIMYLINFIILFLASEFRDRILTFGQLQIITFLNIKRREKSFMTNFYASVVTSNYVLQI